MRVLVINRWNDDFADYGRYIDVHRHELAYVTIPGHAPLIPDGTRHVEFVDDLTDLDLVLAAAQQCRKAVGGFDRVLALSEFDLLTGARVREVLDVPGPDTAATLRVRDKPTMKQVLGAAGVRVPRHAPVSNAAEVAAFAAATGGAVAVKPRTGAASIGCVCLPAGVDAERALAGTDLTGYQVDEFLDGPIWHVDGLLRHGAVVFSKPSRYVNTCYDFAQGRPLGSVVRAGSTADAVDRFAAHCLHVLGLRDGAFHLEVIETRSGLAFLEVGARVGGGEIPFVLRDAYGVDLVGDWIRIELGEEPRTVPGTNHAGHTGFLMIPEPVGQRLVSRESMVGRVPHLYAEELPEPGHVFDGHGGYDILLGRFRYRASNASAIDEAIDATLGAYHYRLEPVDGEG